MPSPHRPLWNFRAANARIIAFSLVALLMFAPLLLAQAQTDKVFRITGADPKAVLEAVRGLYGDRATIVLAQDRLVVRGDDRVIEEIARLLTQLDPAPRRLQFTLAVGLPGADSGVETYRTRNTRLDGQQLDGVEGVPVVLAKIRTTERAVFAPWSWWVAIEEVPADAETIALIAKVRDQQVTLDVRYRLKRGEQWESFESSVSGSLGAWLPLLTGPGDASGGRRTRSTASGAHGSLSARVDDLR